MIKSQNLTNEQALKDKKKRKWGDRIFIICVLLIPICHWLFFTGYVNVTMFFRAFTKQKIDGSFIFTAEHFGFIFRVLTGQKEAGYWSLRSLWNSISILPLVVVFGHPLTFLTSYYIYKKYPGYKIFRIVMMMPTIIAAVVYCQFWTLNMDLQYGLINKIINSVGLGHIIPPGGWLGNAKTAWGNIWLFSLWTTVGGSTMLYFSSAMTRIPTSLFESADLDGATEMKKLLKIVLPLMWPIYCTMTITSLGIIFSWYLPAYLMTAQDKFGTSTIGVIIYKEAANFTADVGRVACLGVYVFVLGGIWITLSKHFMTKLYEEVEY